ncbi:major capsid protein [Variovorax sp. GB1P17]|uniref:major capsid protein n=1 Tax=Variovorax sp. GB1P17 TaxID=3443740 RepID=UPI003F46D40A
MNKHLQAINLSKRAKRVLVLAAAVGVASANAAGEGMDVSAVVAAIAAVSSSVILIGNADLIVRVGVKAFSYVRSALGR